MKAIDDALRETNLPPESIEFEITENSTLNHDDAIETLQKLHEKGVKIAFDDFGTGYASLSYLTRFPLSRIKIDRNFVRKIPDDADAAAIVRSLVVMGHNLGLEVIAEGVETEAQAAFLLAEGCEEAQGFLYCEPVSAVDFEKHLRAKQLANKAAHRLARGLKGGRGRGTETGMHRGARCDPLGAAEPTKCEPSLNSRSLTFGAFGAHSVFLGERLLGQGEPTLRHVEQ